MNSHHGTHIRKPGEGISRTLKPETPTALADGDILTFGKSVGRHNEYVRPVVVRVELIRSPRPESPFKPVTPVKDVVTVDLTKPSPLRSSSGRYGVYVPRSPSSDNFSSEQGSDIEELHVPASGPNALPLHPRANRSYESPFGRASDTLMGLLPPSHIPGAPLDEESQPAESIPSSPSRTPTRLQSPIHSPAWPEEQGSRRPSASYSPDPFRHSPTFSELEAPFQYQAGHASCDVGELERQSAEISRSTSPMDLASPSPVPARRHLSLEKSAEEEPNIIGAWRESRSSSPNRHSPAHMNEPLSTESALPSIPKAMSLDSICFEPNSQSVGGASAISQEPAIEAEAPNEPTQDVSAFQVSLKRLRCEVSKLQAHRRKYKARFNNNVHLISEKLSDLDERMSNVNAQYMLLVDSVDSAVEVDVPDLQAQIDALREQGESLPIMTTELPLHERADVQASIQTLHELVVEMRNLRTTTLEQMSAELEAVRAARDAALAKIAAQVEAQVCIARHLTAKQRRSEGQRAQAVPVSAMSGASLKRKRSDFEDKDETDAGRARVYMEHKNSNNGVGASGAVNGTITDAEGPTTFANSHPVVCHRHSVPPSAKRVRRIATVAVQSATAVTVGAIATWSALAFS
ncbi:hypothetical protein DXG03_004566 [Asterophora parasitica]|uniref:Uncharacterized protein n=1 Tax=Asterophora parasitica TaxID=117018 RepID=A0A9P7G2I3_9AGAR|nr:hypothetical protein DXG03_004566 [Asterophora parasitica]